LAKAVKFRYHGLARGVFHVASPDRVLRAATQATGSSVAKGLRIVQATAE
jgi:hypothetical protein